MMLLKPVKKEKVRARLHGKINRNCKECGAVFAVYACRTKNGRGWFCSDDCSRKGSRTKVERICQTCGQNFMAIPSQTKHYKGANQYCSRPCAYQGMVTKTRAIPIKDQYGRSGRKDDKEWQLAVREKDDYTCQRCGKYDRYIHTHHVAPRSRRPDLKHVVENGKCLCGPCHNWCHHHGIEATALGLLSDATYERAKQEPRQCSLCDSRHFGLGLCLKHYKRFKKYGDPLLSKPHGGRGHNVAPRSVSSARSER